MLTGEKNSYGTIRPRNSFEPNRGFRHLGAVELAVRYSQLSIDGDAFAGFAKSTTAAQQAKEVGIGVNWLLNQYVKLATDYEHTSFRMATSTVTDTSNGRPRLVLTITDSAWAHRSDIAWLRARGLGQSTGLIEDHGKLVHLFLISADGHSAFAHLHPTTVDTVTFTAPLPSVPAGNYSVFADVVHASGLTETLTSTVTIAAPPRPVAAVATASNRVSSEAAAAGSHH